MRKPLAVVVLLYLLSAHPAVAQTERAERSSAALGMPTYSTLLYGYKNVQGECELAGDAVTIYWNSVPCFYLHVVPSVAGTPITGSVALNGTAPDGTQFTSGPHPIYSDPDGGGHLYIIYNDGLGDAGEYVFMMSYLGDDNYQASQSVGRVVVPVRSLPTTITITGPTAILAGNSAVFSAKLGSPVFRSIGLWGPIALYDRETLLQETSAWSNSFLLVTPLLSPDTHTISVAFEGTLGKYGVLNAAASASNSLTVVAMERNPQVGRIVELAVSPNPPASGEVVSLMATVTDNTQLARGTVTFFDGRTPLSTLPLISNASGERSTATLKLALGVGRHVITARSDAFTAVTPEGAQAYASATSAPTEVLVSTPARTETRLLVESDGSKYRLSASVFGYGSVSLAGVVNFRDLASNTPLGSVVLDSTQSSPAFTEPHEIPFRGKVGDIATADLNGDGIADLIVADAAENAIHVLMGKGGAFETQQDYAVSAIPRTLVVADVDRDDTPDILVGTIDSRIEVLSRQTDGTLTVTKTLAIDFVPHRVLAGDLNGDGITDLVILGQDETSHLSVVLGNSTGRFDDPVSYAIPELGMESSALLADLNNDGVPDLLISTSTSSNYEMLGIGDGTLQPAIPLDLVSGTPIAADFNNDGNTDLALVPFEGAVTVQLGRGDGTFASPRYYYARSIAQTGSGQQADSAEPTLSIAMADFNADGIPDLITSDAIYLGSGDGTFSDGIPRGADFRCISDLNGDGVQDLLNATKKGLQVRFGGTATTVSLAGAAVRGNGTHDVEAEFMPLAGVPYAESVSQPVQVEAAMPAFKFAIFPSTLSFRQGETTLATLAIASLNGYSGTLSFRCEGLPRDLTCTLRPSSLTLNETKPYDQADLLVSMTAPEAAFLRQKNLHPKISYVFAPILIGVLGLVYSRISKFKGRDHWLLVVMLGTISLSAFSCGGRDGIVETPHESNPAKNSTYSLTIAVSDGTISRTTQMNVTVH